MYAGFVACTDWLGPCFAAATALLVTVWLIASACSIVKIQQTALRKKAPSSGHPDLSTLAHNHQSISQCRRDHLLHHHCWPSNWHHIGDRWCSLALHPWHYARHDAPNSVTGASHTHPCPSSSISQVFHSTLICACRFQSFLLHCDFILPFLYKLFRVF